MTLRFAFNLDKSIQVIGYLLSRLGTTDKVKLMKLVYLADREHFIRHGYPITGDAPYAMPHGPVPSATLDAVDGQTPGAQERVFRYIHVDDFRVSVRSSPGTSVLAADECATLDDVITRHGPTNTWALVNQTHQLPEYVAAYIEGTSRPITYEAIARASGDERRYRNDRTVISPEGAAHMLCPFPSGSDL